VTNLRRHQFLCFKLRYAKFFLTVYDQIVIKNKKRELLEMLTYTPIR